MVPLRAMLVTALRAQRLDFQRTAEDLEIADRGAPVQHLLELGNFDIAHAAAFDAHHMMMGREVAVVARAVVQRGDLTRLADFAQCLQRPMHRCT